MRSAYVRWWYQSKILMKKYFYNFFLLVTIDGIIAAYTIISHVRETFTNFFE